MHKEKVQQNYIRYLACETESCMVQNITMHFKRKIVFEFRVVYITNLRLSKEALGLLTTNFVISLPARKAKFPNM